MRRSCQFQALEVMASFPAPRPIRLGLEVDPIPVFCWGIDFLDAAAGLTPSQGPTHGPGIQKGCLPGQKPSGRKWAPSAFQLGEAGRSMLGPSQAHLCGFFRQVGSGINSWNSPSPLTSGGNRRRDGSQLTSKVGSERDLCHCRGSPRML